jgi:hypothetical protein
LPEQRRSAHQPSHVDGIGIAMRQAWNLLSPTF